MERAAREDHGMGREMGKETNTKFVRKCPNENHYFKC